MRTYGGDGGSFSRTWNSVGCWKSNTLDSKSCARTKPNGPRIPCFRVRHRNVGTKLSMLSWIIYGERWQLMPAYWTPLKSGIFASVCSRICDPWAFDNDDII